MLEPDSFDSEFVVMPLIDRRTKVGKDLYEQFVQQSEDKQIITQEQYETISAMRDSVLSNKYAVALLKGNHEHSFYTQDELTKETIKVR